MKTFYIDTPTFLWDKENEKIITDQERNINVWFYEMGEIKLTDQFAIDDFFKIHQDEYVVFYMNKDSIYHYKNDEKFFNLFHLIKTLNTKNGISKSNTSKFA